MSEITNAGSGKRRRSAQDWAQWLRLFETSGQKVKEFCREKGLPPSSFSYWRRRLRSQPGTKASEKLIEIRPAAVRAGVGSWAMRIAVRGGICVEVEEGTEASWVAGVVRALAAEVS